VDSETDEIGHRDGHCRYAVVCPFNRLRAESAHIHSPAGGQGMNTGMMDAANLAWKLALVVEGRATDSLLDTYGQERLPVGTDVMRLSDRIFRWSKVRNPVKRAVRNAVVPTLTGLPTVKRHAARQVSQVSITYPAGPLVRPDGSRRRPRPGERVADLEIRTALAGGRHVLVIPRGATFDHHADLVDVVAGDHYALVRPDGFLAARGRENVVDYLRQFASNDTREPVVAK
jgi:hypothetical protein